jgi:hypothetical protein
MTAQELKRDTTKLIPVILFMLAQSAAAIWWASGMNSEVRQLQEFRTESKRVLTEDIPEMKATLKNIERMMFRESANGKRP